MRNMRLPIASILLAALLVLTGIALSRPQSAAAADQTLAQVRDRVDTWIANRWQIVIDRQNAYFSSRGHYWQGLRTNINDLEYTTSFDASVLANNLASKPSDQAEAWLDVFPEFSNAPIPAVIIIDTYDGPQGAGWVARIILKWNGQFYTRAGQVGPESTRAHGWTVVIPEGAR